MAEVGVLELQIHDNSAKAASGLGHLASALTRVQNALGSGLKLGNTANQIAKLVEKMQTAIPEESISRIERLAKAVETLNKAGGINLSGIKGLSKEIQANVSEMKAAVESVTSTKAGTQGGFAGQFQEAKQIAEETVATAERLDKPLMDAGRLIGVAADNAERLRDTMADIHSYARLGSGSSPLRLGPGGVSPENMLSTWVDYGKQWQTGWTNEEHTWAPMWATTEFEKWFDETSAGIYRFAKAMDEAIRKTTQFMALASGQSYPRLGAGNAGMELSTWVDKSQQWAPDWTYGRQPRLGDGSQNWVWGSGKVSETSETVAGVEEVKNSVQETAAEVEKVKNSLQDTGAATGGFEDLKASVQGANQALEDNIELLNEQRQARQEAMAAENQARLERNYPKFRELFMSGEKPWTTQVPEMYGFSPEIIKESETYAEAAERSAKAFAVAAENAERVQRAVESVAFNLRIGSGQSFPLLGSGGVPNENALSTWVDYSKQYAPDWTNGYNYKPDWVFGGNTYGGFSKSYPPNSIFGEGTVTDAEKTTSAMQGVAESAKTAGSAMQGLSGAVKGSSKVSVACTDKLGSLDKELKEKKTDASEATSAFQNFRTGIQNLFSPITGLIGQLARVAKYRMLRAIIRQITQAFKEGVENYYHYSEAINNGFSNAMDNAATSLQTLRNSIGAAVAPLIQALIPYLQQVVSWFITLINYVNQFISLVTGKSTWSKAVDTPAKAFEETKKKAGGASKAIKETDNAVKDLLADFDELNIIQSQNEDTGGSGAGGGGGGSGKAATDYLKMFTESAFSKRVKNLVEGIKKNFGSVGNLVKEIGAGILAWKVSTAFAGIIGQAAALVGSGIIMDFVFKMSGSFTDTYLNTGEPMWLLLNGLTPIVGGFIAKKLLSMVGLTGMASYSIPIALLFAAAGTIKATVSNTDVSALDEKSIVSSITAALEGGAATGLILSKAGTLTAAGAVKGGIGGALVTFGVAIGLKATADVARDGKITEDTIKADAISSGFVGAGLALVGTTLGLAGGTALAVGAGAAVLTFGVLIGVQAILEQDKVEPVKWGKTKLTAEQIEGYVGKMFEINPAVQIQLLEEKITIVEGSKTELEHAAAKAFGTLQIVKLGIDDSDESLHQLETDVDSMVERFHQNTKDRVVQVQATLSFVPTEGEDGKPKGETTAAKITEGWTSLDEEMTSLGDQLAAAFQTAYSTKIGTAAHEEAVHTIEELTEMMTDISNAITYGTETSKILSGFESLADGVTRETAADIISSFKETRDQILAQQTAALQQTAEGSLALSLAFGQLARRKGITQEERDGYRQKSEEFMTLYRQQLNDLKDDAEAATEEILGDSDLRDQTHDYLVSAIDKDYLAKDIQGQLMFYGFTEDLGDNELTDDDLQGMFEERMKLFLESSIPDDAQIYKDALDSNLIGYGEIFNDAFLQSVTNGLDLGNATKEVRDRYIATIRSIFGDEVAAKIHLPPMEAEQTVELETEVVDATTSADTEASDVVSGALGAYAVNSMDFDLDLSSFYGDETGQEWKKLWDAMFSGGAGTAEAAETLRGRMNEIVRAALSGTGIEESVLQGLESGEFNYLDIFQGKLVEAVEDALNLEGASPEIQDKWNDILEEILGTEVSPEIEVDPELTGKTNRKLFNTNQIVAGAGMTTFAGGHGYDPYSTEATAAGVQAGTAQMQTDLQTGMANRQSDIQSGVQAGTGGLLTVMQSILAVAQAINNKDFTVNIVPSTTLGEVNKKSGRRLGRVTGNMEAPS